MLKFYLAAQDYWEVRKFQREFKKLNSSKGFNLYKNKTAVNYHI